MLTALIVAHGVPALARAAGVDERTLRRWASGRHWPPLAAMMRMLDVVVPDVRGRAILPYRGDAEYDDVERRTPLGISQWSLRAASGRAPEIEETQ